MARFAKCAAVLMAVDGVMATLFMFGPGLTVPPATSVSPPSVCIAQAQVYQGIGLFQSNIVGLLLSSVLLCAIASLELAGSSADTVSGITHPLGRKLVRGYMVLAVVLSAVSAGLGLRTYAFVLEAKVSVFACLSAGARISFFGSYAVAALVCTYVFGRFLWVAMFDD